jgi:hypothetical protein
VRRAWVSEAPGEAGEWLSESDYRASGYTPDFDSLPVLIVQRIASVAISTDHLPEADREFFEREKNTDRT